MTEQSPIDVLEQNVKNFRSNAAGLREDAARKFAQAEALEGKAEVYEAAIARLRADQ